MTIAPFGDCLQIGACQMAMVTTVSDKVHLQSHSYSLSSEVLARHEMLASPHAQHSTAVRRSTICPGLADVQALSSSF